MWTPISLHAREVGGQIPRRERWSPKGVVCAGHRRAPCYRVVRCRTRRRWCLVVEVGESSRSTTRRNPAVGQVRVSRRFRWVSGVSRAPVATACAKIRMSPSVGDHVSRRPRPGWVPIGGFLLRALQDRVSLRVAPHDYRDDAPARGSIEGSGCMIVAQGSSGPSEASCLKGWVWITRILSDRRHRRRRSAPHTATAVSFNHR